MSEGFILDAVSIDLWQRCRRQALLSADWKPRKWRPKALFAAVLRQAIFTVSNGGDAAAAIQDGTTRFLQEGASPGLEIPHGSNPYQLAREWVTMLSTVVRAAAKLVLLMVKHAPPVMLSPTLTWQPLSWVDDAGQLHRWIVVDHWNEDARYRELHSWRTIGDIVMAEAPMMLHVVEIGGVRDGRLHCSWTRAWTKPAIINGKTHFRSPKGEVLRGWDPFYLADHRNDDHDAWVDQMMREGEVGRLMKHVTVNVPSQAVVDDTRLQMVFEGDALRMATLTRLHDSWRMLPMARGACDTFVPCPYQSVCYADPAKLVKIEDLGLYLRKDEAIVLTN